MGKMSLTVSDDIEKQFRQVVGSIYGAGRGSLQKATEESFQLWIKLRKMLGSDVDLLDVVLKAVEKWLKEKKGGD